MAKEKKLSNGNEKAKPRESLTVAYTQKKKKNQPTSARADKS